MSSPQPAILWSHKLSAAPTAMALAQEAGRVFAADRAGEVAVYDRRGKLLGQVRRPAPAQIVAAAEDGSAFAIADRSRDVTWLAPDLSPRWTKSLAAKPTALAVDTVGRFLAAADAGNRLHLFMPDGTLWTPPVESARPLRYLAFVPGAPLLLAAADFGLVAAFDFRTRQWAWHDSPVVHLGGLACDGAGEFIGVAAYSEGVRQYSAIGKPQSPVATPEPCRLLAVSFDGRKLLTAGLAESITGMTGDGQARFTQRFEHPIRSIALAALGDWAAVALEDGRVMGLKVAFDSY